MSFDHGKLHVLLVPVQPIKRAVYARYAQQIKQLSRIALRDIPPDTRGERAILSATPRSDGYLTFSFVDHFERWNSYLEDFEPCRRLWGIVGVSDCEEWDSLSNANIEFQQTLRKFPKVVSSRCYAFNPRPGHVDEIDGVVTIPNVGDTGFYLSTLLADLASTLLYELSNMVAALETKAVIQSPIENEAPGSPFDFVPPSPRGKFSSAVKEYSLSSSKSSPELSFDAGKSDGPASETPGTAAVNGSGPQVNMLSPTLSLPPPPQSRMATSLGGGTQPGNQEGILFGQNINSQFRASAVSGASEATLNDKASRRKMQGRSSKLRGDLYVLAGRWAEGLAHYNEAVTIARTTGDPLWEAAATERHLTTTVMLAWQPHVGESHAESDTHKLNLSVSDTRHMDQEAAAQLMVDAKEVPERYRLLLEVYAKLLPGQGAPDTLPAALMVDATFRCARLHFALLRHNGWSTGALSDIFRGTISDAPRDLKRLSASIGNATGITKAIISDFLSYAYIPLLSALPIPQRIDHISTLAAFYGMLGYTRKRGALLREITAIAGNSIKQARLKARGKGFIGKMVTTAPEMEGNEVIIAMLQQTCDAYGINVVARVRAGSRDKRISLIAGPIGNFSGSTTSEGFDDTRYGWPDLQVGAIRDAISVCEMLPEYSSALRFTISALRDVSGFMPPLDQLQLSQNIPAIFSHATRRGATFALDYWGPTNLLMSIELVPLSHTKQPVDHVATTTRVDAGISGPFIYSTNVQKRTSAQMISLVSQEPVEFLVTLQNPFMFDLDIQEIELSTSGVDFATVPISLNIPANSFHTSRLSGTPMTPGKLALRGCRVRLVCSESREFLLPIYNEAEMVAERTREGLEIMPERLKGSGLVLWRNRIIPPEPSRNLKFLECRVIPEQPLLLVKSSSLIHGALMLQDGERSRIQLVVENVSPLPVNFVKITCADSHTNSVQAQLRDSALTESDAYELDLTARRDPVLSWESPDRQLCIEPKSHYTFIIAVFGKLGCSSGNIQIDYASIDQTNASTSRFFGRRLTIDVFMTIHRAIEAFSMTLQRFQTPISEPLSRRQIGRGGMTEYTFLDPQLEDDFRTVDENRHCLLAVDVRNVYGQPFEITFQRLSEDADPTTVCQRIEPGATSTLLLRMDRLRLSSAEVKAPLPTVVGKQFVISKTPASIAEEMTARELFWYREAFLRNLKASWREFGTHRCGDISLRALDLSRPMLDVLKLDDVVIELSLAPNDTSANTDGSFRRSVDQRPIYRVQVDEFVDVQAEVRNDTERVLDMVIHFDHLLGGAGRPSAGRRLNDDEDEELDRYVVFEGTPSVPRKGVRPKETVNARMPVSCLSLGQFEIGCSVEADGRLYTCRRPLLMEL